VAGPRHFASRRACSPGESGRHIRGDITEANMEPKGLDMGDYQQRYQDFDIEVAVEQVLTGVKAHFRVLRDDAVVVDWRLVHIESLWSTEHAAAEAGFEAARAVIDAGLAV
jgi:hypothetical protein